MKGIAIFGLVVIAIVITLLIIFSLWVERLKKPSPGRDCHDTSDWLWDDTCTYIQEKSYDPSLKSPEKLYPVLTGFVNSTGAGNSIFLPCWYRFRYVNVKTGSYSDFSDWSQSPVMSGSCCLPCPGGPGNCPSTVKQGYYSCPSNQPTIGIEKSLVQYSPTEMQKDGSFIFLNLHRYVGSDPSDANPPPKNVKDEIIGYLLPTTFVGNTSYYSWVDVLSNPCKEGCKTPSWCRKQSNCGSCSI